MTYTPTDFADLRGLSLRQPHADLVVLGRKRVETRGRDIGAQPGQVVAIHASLTAFAEDEAPSAWAIRRRDSVIPMRFGALLGLARVASVWKMRRSSLFGEDGAVCLRGTIPSLRGAVDGRWWEEQPCGGYGKGRFLIVLFDVVLLERPVPCRGSLGLWRVPDVELGWVREQVAR